MSIPSIDLDADEPRGIIICTGAPKPAGAPFRAYFWSEAEDGACAARSEGRILESPPAPDGLTPSWRASP